VLFRSIPGFGLLIWIGQRRKQATVRRKSFSGISESVYTPSMAYKTKYGETDMTTIYIIAISIICILLLIVTNNHQNQPNKEQIKASTNKTRYLMIVLNYLSIVCAISAYFINSINVGYLMVPISVNMLALLVMTIGLSIRIIAMKTLGKYYSKNLFVNKENPLITNGLYGIIRHPIYLGDLIIYFGLGIAVSNYLIFGVLIITSIPAFLKRIKDEEYMMVSKFGTDYIEYRKSTYKLLPRIY
jgi:protein-S-isoprenylcysteine O-methyltransferase Ste14